jgi:hypothetical protein
MVSARTIRLVDVVPGTFATQRIVGKLGSDLLALVQLLGENVLVRAGQALEAGAAFDGGGGGVAGGDSGDAEHVVAVWADWIGG